jgi:F420-non-reducing hydrogenase iron-sulfur subunit
MNVLRPLIEFCGIEADRLHNRWISSAEAPEFAEEIHMFVEKVRKLGPSPLAKPKVVHPAEKAA